MSQVRSASTVRKWLFQKALSAKAEAVKEGKPTPAVWDKLVFSKIRQAFGGRVRYAASGSAPLSRTTVDFLRLLSLIFAEDLAEGYGLTETWATGTATQAEDRNTYGHVGSAGASVEVKLMNVDDMNYLLSVVLYAETFTTDEPEPRGEIWIRGESVFKGYYRNPEVTKEVLRDDGWFATGDIGKWRRDGKLQIIDRKKNIFKLAQGEYIRPEYIEGVYKRSPYVGNIFVHGNSDQTYLVGIVYPDPEVFAKWAEQNGLKSISTNLDALIKEPGVKNAIEKDMERIAKKEKLQGFEKVKQFVLTKEDFTVENGLLTSTMKLKRNVARTKFAKEIEQMYAEGIKTQSKL
ncbi:long-chain-fatty-acid-CoA ligase [Reticulomyxa filosa]|uniref:Long-chain-fatty-acid-CoA ligase n=1 Tax=Reticulomyxa filosa TaxID=46433 RepID=X6P541_RETFI|nr:long-chain-fatty-acid-CoA ligase [Reticulomyxa filosa]|eukprot:ETO33306.1 long-chain-fatty-acid-CoA ligase [Reticulomyxa filosa]